MSNEEVSQELISIFMCKNDPDIEGFLKNKAIIFEKLGKSRTFFVFDEDENHFAILGYFTIALQILKVLEALSNRKVKNFDGFNAKFNGEKITEFPTILIGQFGKNDKYKNRISGYELMQYCLNTVLDGQNYLGGRIVMLECKDVPYLCSFYEQFGFNKLEKDYEKNELLQFIKIFQENELIEKEDT
jgi:predicted GNAT family N-acyltransferase